MALLCVCLETNCMPFSQSYHEFSVEKQIDHGLIWFTAKGKDVVWGCMGKHCFLTLKIR